MIERLARQRLRLTSPGGFGLGIIEAARRLHQRIVTAARRPRTLMTVGAERDTDDAGPDAGGGLGRKALRRDRARPVALHENIRIAQQRRKGLAPGRVAQIDRG